MEYHRNEMYWAGDSMGLFSFRMMRFGGYMTLAAVELAQAQTQQRPPIGGIGSPPDAMIFYVAHGAAGHAGRAAPTGLPLKARCSGIPTSV